MTAQRLNVFFSILFFFVFKPHPLCLSIKSSIQPYNLSLLFLQMQETGIKYWNPCLFFPFLFFYDNPLKGCLKFEESDDHHHLSFFENGRELEEKEERGGEEVHEMNTQDQFLLSWSRIFGEKGISNPPSDKEQNRRVSISLMEKGIQVFGKGKKMFWFKRSEKE